MPKSRPTSAGPVSAGSRRAEESEVRVLTQRQATCCAIVMQKVGDLRMLCGRLRALDPISEDDRDRLRALCEMLDEKQVEQLNKLAAESAAAGESSSSGKGIRSLERQLFPLVQLDRVRQRLRLIRIGESTQHHRQQLCHMA